MYEILVLKDSFGIRCAQMLAANFVEGAKYMSPIMQFPIAHMENWEYVVIPCWKILKFIRL